MGRDSRSWLSLFAMRLATACTRGSSPLVRATDPPSAPVSPPAPPMGIADPPATFGPPAGFTGAATSSGPFRIVPTDERGVTHGARRALPISGGTLLVTSDGAWAVAADPERDRISIVDLATTQLSANIDLKQGDEPGRLTEDDVHRVHVALRSGGAVVTVDPATQTIVARRRVCAAPRGIAFDPATRALQVSCASGELVTLPVDFGAAISSVAIGADLRDVIESQGSTFVSRFKRAELVQLRANGQPGAAQRPADITDQFPEASGSLVVDHLQADMAWRTRQAPDGSIYMLHEGARTGEIDITPAAEQPQNEFAPSVSPYGRTDQPNAPEQCAGVVQSELSAFDESGQYIATARFNAALAVDVAAAVDLLAVAEAGTRDPAQPAAVIGPGLPPTPPASSFAADNFGQLQGRVLLFNASGVRSQSTEPTTPACLKPDSVLQVPGQPTAVAFAPDGRLLVQSREPASLTVLHSPIGGPDSGDDAGVAPPEHVDLGGDSVYDTGHELFHRAPGAQLACASCHGEGAEDGHVWVFSGQGQRRSQALHVGLGGTEPLHWDGELADVSALMEEVMVSRMGGVHQSAERSAALRDWLFALQPPAPLRPPDDPAAQRGKQLFEGQGGCTQCHNGPKLTNNDTVDVGTGKAFQVPSLIGVGHRGPWLHDGCAATLRERFAPACGGKQHGQVAQLASAQIDDLVAYLESL